MNYQITIVQSVWKEDFLQSQWGAFRIKVDFRFWRDKRAFNFHFTLVFNFLLCTRGWKVENRTFWICGVLKLLVAISADESCFLYKNRKMTKLLKNLVRTLSVSFLLKSRQKELQLRKKNGSLLLKSLLDLKL